MMQGKNFMIPVDSTGETTELMFKTQYVAEWVLRVAQEEGLLQIEERKAVALCLWEYTRPTPFLKCKIGTTFPNDEFRAGCWELAEEKVARQFNLGHMSSYQSRNEKERKYGGAIAVLAGVLWGIGISGLKELEDEAIALVSAIYIFDIPWEKEVIQVILRGSRNVDLTHRILVAMKRNDRGYYESRIAA